MATGFRDPAGDLVHAQLRVLAEHLRGAVDEARVRAAIDELMRFQAVFAQDPADAVSVLSPLRSPEVGEDRLTRLRALALQSFDHHRSRMAAIRERESRRATFVERRARGKA